MNLRNDANILINEIIREINPEKAVREALQDYPFGDGKIIMVSIGKAAWQMAKAASEVVDYEKGIVITKYNHVKGEIRNTECCEAGHPVVDENSFKATEKALKLTKNLSSNDTVLFLVSGGGSALFEKSYISLEELQDINRQLLSSGADINEINTIRKRLSMVKAGRFARACYPARVVCIIISDVIGDRLDSIASGPAFIDRSDRKKAFDIIERYHLNISEKALKCLRKPLIKQIDNVDYRIVSNATLLAEKAKDIAERLGYESRIIDEKVTCMAETAGKNLADYASEVAETAEKPVCLIETGETVVEVKGTGKGGRNQHLALTAAKYIEGKNIVILSLGSDGSDGPTDAAGGIVDGNTVNQLREKNLDIDRILLNNDSYHGLKAIDSLIMTGPTGTNINDVMIALIDSHK